MLLHLLFLVGYAGLAAALALYLPELIPGILPAWSFAAAVGGFLVCALLHEVYARYVRESDFRERLTMLRRSHARVEEEMTWARREMKGVLEALERAAAERRSRRDEARAIDEVMAEVKLLKSVVEGVSGKMIDKLKAPRSTPTDGRPKSLPAAPAVAEPLMAQIDQQEMLRLVHAALRDDRIEVVLQPIVTLPQRKRRAYECYTRLRTPQGEQLKAEDYISVAETAGLVSNIDNMLLFRCTQLVRRLQQRHSSAEFFCNISRHTLQDVAFFSDFVDYLETNPQFAPHLVFEFPLAELAEREGTIDFLLTRLSELGCRLSVDQVSIPRLDLGRLMAQKISFVKLDAGELHRLARDEGAHAAEALIRRIRGAEIEPIVEKIEQEEVLVDLLELGIDCGQGYLFGEPRLARAA